MSGRVKSIQFQLGASEMRSFMPATTSNTEFGGTLTRRELLRRSGTGLAMLGLAGVMSDGGLLAAPAGEANDGYKNPLAERLPHFPGKAKRVIHLFMNGGPSHVDTFDPKPARAK